MSKNSENKKWEENKETIISGLSPRNKEILKKYLGEDFFKEQDQKINGVPYSLPEREEFSGWGYSEAYDYYYREYEGSVVIVRKCIKDDGPVQEKTLYEMWYYLSTSNTFYLNKNFLADNFADALQKALNFTERFLIESCDTWINRLSFFYDKNEEDFLFCDN